ncbi:MAG: PAS domain S-box protein [Halorientalis sp.]
MGTSDSDAGVRVVADLDRGLCRSIAANVPAAVLTIDRDKRILFASPATAETLGYEPQTLVGSHLRTLIPERLQAEQLAHIEQSVCAAETPPTDFELRTEHRSGDERTLSVSFERHHFEGQELFTGIVRDISDARRQTRKLEAQRVLFERVQDLAHVGIWEYDPQTDELAWSKGVYDIHGVDSSYEPTLEGALECYHPDDRDEIERLVERALSEGEFYETDLRIVRADGAVRDVRVRGEVVITDGEVSLLRGVFQDVTQPRAREKELERYEALTENMDEAAFVVDADWRLEYTNQSALTHVDRRRDELVGQSFVSVLAEYALADDASVRIEQALTTVFDGSDATDRLELRFALPGGEFVGEFQFSSFVSDGEPKAVVIARDVTERNARERALVESQRRQRTLFNQSPDGIIVHDMDGAILDVNDQTVADLGYSRAELQSMTAADVDANSSLAELTEKWATLDVGAKLKVESRHRRKDGSTFPVELWINKVQFEDEPRFIALSRDITERKAYQQQLTQQRDGLEMLNQMVRHDIRNDLQLVLAYAEMLETQVDETGTGYLQTVIDSAENAVELTKTARDLADVMLQTETDHEPIALAPTLEQQVDEVRSSHANAALTVDGPVPDVTVRADDMLQSVFRNLLKNAIQHNDTDVPTVEVAVTERPNSVLVHVADNGPGIPPAQRDEIFGKSAKGLESDGTGIGLYLVSTLVEQYGGDVWIGEGDAHPDRQPPTDLGGAIFTVELQTVQ